MKTEAEALEILSLTQEGILKNGFRKTLRKALEFGWRENGEYKEVDKWIEHLLVERWNEMKPPFVPDATRFKWGYLGEGRMKMPCVELWEIEKTNPLNQSKIDKIECYLLNMWDSETRPDFEIWTANSRGRGVDRVYSMFEDMYGVKVDYDHA